MKEISGQLIKSGRFKQAIPVFYTEIDLALQWGVLYRGQSLDLCEEFAEILLNPSSFEAVETLGNKMMRLAIRIPNYVTKVKDLPERTDDAKKVNN